MLRLWFNSDYFI